MAKRTPVIEMTSYGIYSLWDAKAKELPQIKAFTQTVTADEGVEFGFTVNIKKAKGQLLQFCIHHPGIINKRVKYSRLLMEKCMYEVMIGTSILAIPFSYCVRLTD